MAARDQRKETLLAEYHAGMAQADQHWNEYLKTNSQKAFGEYLAINRSLSAVYTELVAYGMTLDEIKQQSDGGAFDANLD